MAEQLLNLVQSNQIIREIKKMIKDKIYFLYERIRHNWRFEISYMKNLIFKQSRNEIKKIKSYKDKYKRLVGFLIANGPSLNKIDLNLLKNQITIGMNRIYLKNFIPTYYILEDHLVAEDNSNEISNLSGSIMFIPRDLKYCIKNNKNIIYTNLVRRYKNKPKFSKEFWEKCYWGGTVTFFGLQLAYLLGFKKLYIVGLDHSYTVPPDERGQKIVSQSLDLNHFDPNYFGPGKRYHRPNLDLMEKSYKIAKENFERDGRKIYNATPGSKLNVFDKVNFEEIPEFR